MLVIIVMSNSVHADSGFMAILLLALWPHFLGAASNSGPSKIGDEAQSLEKEPQPHSAALFFWEGPEKGHSHTFWAAPWFTFIFTKPFSMIDPPISLSLLTPGFVTGWQQVHDFESHVNKEPVLACRNIGCPVKWDLQVSNKCFWAYVCPVQYSGHIYTWKNALYPITVFHPGTLPMKTLGTRLMISEAWISSSGSHKK